MKTVLKFSMLVAVVAIVLAVPVTPFAHAYGGRNQQWQVTFSINCNIPSACGGSGTFGFWGWCEFGGTDPTAMTGNSGDCQVTDYGRAGPGMPQNPAHNAVIVTGWHIAVVPNNAPYPQFILDSGTITCTGPGANTPACFSGQPFPQPTGIPGVPGHYNTLYLIGMPAAPGFHYNSQVNLLP